MSSALEPSESLPRQDGKNPTPPAFLDLADSSTRLGSNKSELSTRMLEIKRMEHERQRAMHYQAFEHQMLVLKQKQEEELLGLPADPLQHVAVSAPTTPPRLNAPLIPERVMLPSGAIEDRPVYPHPEKRKSVAYSPAVTLQTDAITDSIVKVPIGRNAGAKSMPGSRRPSTGSHDGEEMNMAFDAMSIHERAPGSARLVSSNTTRQAEKRLSIDPPRHYGDASFVSALSAGHMLDQQLDREMQNAMLHLPISDDDKSGMVRVDSFPKLSTASAALDLAPLSQTPPRSVVMGRAVENGIKSSEWPQFPDSLTFRDRRVATNPTMGGSRTLTSAATILGHPSGSPLVAPLSESRRPTPPVLTDNTMGAIRSVPATPLGIAPGARPEGGNKTAGILTPGGLGQSKGLGHFGGLDVNTPSDRSSSLSRGMETPLTFSSIHTNTDDSIQLGAVDRLYGLSGGVDSHFNSYPFETQARSNTGSTALYHHNGSRYGLGIGRIGGVEGKVNGLHGTKHKRADVDREFNRFAGTRLEDLQGEIASLCKDQHGCRYLQKKLEEGSPEHRDMIFRETYGHFPELMTDPFGNYLCQKLLEFSTDEQRTAICESVAKDLVKISLNMHGTRAVQKMIDFLSVQRQASTDVRFDSQIHSIIVALSRHVVVLIKDLNGNHVIQKCLNKLTPEDNQFIYNAVAANCVEVATHRHGCCVLQRCIDHASDLQRVQLVNEITFNALTLVQDPYGNYVVQYILDLNDNRFSDAVIRQFTGNVCALSVQKFSSNVIEKCIRVAEHGTRKLLIDEMLHRSRLEKLLRDSYGNYCVQTALDYADPHQRAMLVEGIRPILPLIRNTPYGKRIQSKLQREQGDQAPPQFGNYPHASAIGAGLGFPAGHVPAQSQASYRATPHLADIYNGASLYPSVPLHGQPSRISSDPYGLSNGTGMHAQNAPPFGNGASFPNMGAQNGFGAVSLRPNDPYARTVFPYGI